MPSILSFLGLDRSEQPTSGAAKTETVRRIVRELDELPPERARFVATFAYVLSRVANADLDISDEEIRAMEEIVARFGHLPEEQAILVVKIARSQAELFGGTENFQVTRELKQVSTREQREELLDCLFAVSAADDSISAAEEQQIRQIAEELGFSRREYVDARSAYNHKRSVIQRLERRQTQQ